MSFDQIVLFALFAGVFAMLLWGKFRYDLIAFTALMLGVLLGVVHTEDAFSGFGHEATIIVALVLIVSAGLVRSGAVLLITRTMVDSGRRLGAHIAIMGTIGAALSGFMNNVAALALLMPVDIQTSRKAGRAPGLSLMPLSFATILGGMITLIGTPPNIIVASIRGQYLDAPYRMFDFAPVGFVTAVAGLLFVATIGWRLIPRATDGGAPVDPMEGYSDYTSELVVPEGAKIVGKRIEELYEQAESDDVLIVGLIRDGKRRYGNQRTTTIVAGDALVIEATPEALDEFRASQNLKFADGKREENLRADGAGLSKIEVVVTGDSRINGRTAQGIGLNWRRHAVILGIRRAGRKIRTRIGKTPVKTGDILLLLVPTGQEAAVTEWLGCLPLAERGLAVTDQTKIGLAVGLFMIAVATASFGFVILPVALGLVVVGYVLFGILPIREIYNHVEWPVVVLLGSMIPLGTALENSGGTELIANGLVSLTQGLPAWAVLTLLMVVTMTLSDVLNNTATAIVAAPVGIQMAGALDRNPDPFLMAVAVAASCAFLTPIGHKNNTLILGPGGYRFGDYWRMGLPLEILVVAVSIPAILFFWPL
ncbi:SLC13 family permease [Maritimibacter sp. DP1N21-5]|uniref:SLC13 family permease n=1 Tax=Maritimibacter sp. DP1N21-5 TaxID=2836867 RepID=UPI001C463909|nr:SLC13 family permease [Maritimibacter sp. DP1N21-5]MBV7409110.1 SLC13 family permease [Maritimibacter sp. DP1N21-5]